MQEQIEEAIAQGFKPVIYIDSALTSNSATNTEMGNIAVTGRKLNVKIVYSNDITELNRLRKAYVFRYGYIPEITSAMIKRKGGKIVSGNLKLY